MRQCILSFIAFTFVILFTMGGYAGGQPKNALAGELPPNSWVTLDLTEAFKKKYPEGRWGHYDGYSDIVYRPDKGTVLIWTNLRLRDRPERNSGFYANGGMEWNPRADEVSVFWYTNWHGGSSGTKTKAYPLPAFDEEPTPTPRHSYDVLAYVPPQKALYTMLGANVRMSGKIDRNEDEAVRQRARNLYKKDYRSTWRLSLETGEWERVEGTAKHTLFPDVWRYEGHMTYWPEKNTLIFLGSKGKRYAHFELDKQVWKKAPKQPSEGFPIKQFERIWHMRSAWDAKRQLWLFRLSNKVITFDPQTAKIRKLPEPYKNKYDRNNITSQRQSSPDNQGSICYISKHDVYMIPRVPGPWKNKTMVFHPDQGKWETVSEGAADLFNGYCQYDAKGDMVVLTRHHRVAKFRYVPSEK